MKFRAEARLKTISLLPTYYRAQLSSCACTVSDRVKHNGRLNAPDRL